MNPDAVRGYLHGSPVNLYDNYPGSLNVSREVRELLMPHAPERCPEIVACTFAAASAEASTHMRHAGVRNQLPTGLRLAEGNYAENLAASGLLNLPGAVLLYQITNTPDLIVRSVHGAGLAVVGRFEHSPVAGLSVHILNPERSPK
ncbi:hypothetical protein ACFORO_26000 [Amycolatopsis halotolerans]|uniref:Uncharacterized protein n=1 Tax=Amycolatopsis halotolerans TaxID=330083 RepID=A0ABV7QMT4_9PSEU